MKASPVLCALALGALQAGCSLGAGQGDVKSDHLYASDCWNAQYDMQPDFFAAVPFRETLQIRVQRGNDLAEVSDGLTVLVDDVQRIRGTPEAPGLLGQALCVSLPPGTAPPGTPVGAQLDPSNGGTGGGPPEFEALVDCDKPLVHMSLYLQQSCHNQNSVLSAVKGSVTFDRLFSGDPNEEQASEKYTEGRFTVEMGDPRDVPLGEPAQALPADKRSTVTGSFSFFFERGQPGQPFP